MHEEITKSIKGKLPELEKALLDMPQVPCDVEHMFFPGYYVRQVTIPAGTCAIGHYQKMDHMNVFLRGRVVMINDDGSHTELVAPMMFKGKPGQKVGYIKEEMVWWNIYQTNETDVETLENTYLDKSKNLEEAKLRIKNASRKLLSSDRDDYQSVLNESGFDEGEVRKMTESEEDQIPMPNGSYKFKIGDSSIEGRGVIATSSIESGEIIGPARIGDKRTPIGRYCNHSCNPNAKMAIYSGSIYLEATNEIAGCKGGLDGEEITVDYRQSLRVARLLSCQE